MGSSKRIKQALLALVVVVILVLTACSSAAPAPTTTASAPTTTSPSSTTTKPATPTTTTAPATTAAKPAQVTLLRYATWIPATGDGGWATSWETKQLVERSGGRLKAEYYFAGTLLPIKTIVTGVGQGVADIGQFLPNYTPGLTPLLGVIQQPVACKDFYSGGLALADLVKMPEVKAELDANNLIFTGTGGGAAAQQILARPTIKTIKDLAGKKINSQSLGPEILNAMGIVTTMIPSTEIYDALAKGTIDGILSQAAGVNVYKHYEVAKNWFALNFGASVFVGVMNKDSYNKLPADLQKLVQDMLPETIEAIYGINEVLGNTLVWENSIKSKVTVYQPSAEDNSKLMQLAQETAWALWAREVTARGLPGQKILDNWIQLNAKYDALPRPDMQKMVDKYKAYYDLPRK